MPARQQCPGNSIDFSAGSVAQNEGDRSLLLRRVDERDPGLGSRLINEDSAGEDGLGRSHAGLTDEDTLRVGEGKEGRPDGDRSPRIGGQKRIADLNLGLGVKG